MDRTAVQEHIRTALTEVLNKEIPELHDDMRLFEDLALDSTSVIELLMGLEDSVGLLIDPDELQPETFATVGTLTEYVSSGLTAEAAG
jgi:acyl carrier protein